MRFLRYLIENFWDFDPSALTTDEEQPVVKTEKSDLTKRDLDTITPRDLQQLSNDELRALDSSVFEKYHYYHDQHRNLDFELDNILKTNNNPQDVKYSFSNLSIPPKPAQGFERYGIFRTASLDVRIGSEMERQLVPILKQMRRVWLKIEKCENIRESIEKLIKKRNRQETRAATDAAEKEVVKKQQHAQSTGNIPNPTRLQFVPSPVLKFGTSPLKMDNPYYKDKSANNKDQYVGHPANYKSWSRPMILMYTQLDKILKRNGKPPLSIMYAGKQNNISFVVVANDNFVWRKYDPLSGSSRNWVYLNGVKIPTSFFLNKPAQEQDQWVVDV